MTQLKKIIFEYKEDDNIINPSSTYIVTADNVNEIKDVVNSLVDEASGVVSPLQVFKYFRFIVPNNLLEDINYSIKFELSKNADFSQPIIQVYCNEEKNIFSKFEDGEWKSLNNISFTTLFANTEFRIDLYDYIENYFNEYNEIPFFGRYKLIDVNTSEDLSDWNGFALAFGNYNNENLFPTTYKEIKINGDEIIFGESTHQYFVNAITQNDESIDITNDCTFEILDENISSLNGNELTSKKVYTTQVQVLTAKYTLNGITYEDPYSIKMAPSIDLIKYFIEGPTILNEGSSGEYTVSGLLSNNEYINLLSSSEISGYSVNCNIEKTNEKIIVTCNSIAHDNETFSLIAKYNNYEAVKQIMIKKKIYTNFSLSSTYSGDNALTYNTGNDNIRVLGDLTENVTCVSTYIRPLLVNSNNEIFDDVKNVKIKEIGTNNLKFNYVVKNNQDWIQISLDENKEIENTQESLVLLIYNDYKTGKALIQPETIKIFKR